MLNTILSIILNWALEKISVAVATWYKAMERVKKIKTKNKKAKEDLEKAATPEEAHEAANEIRKNF